MPTFQHAFNTQPVDDVVGAGPWPDSEENDASIIWQFCHNVIEPYYNTNTEAQAGVPQLPVPEALKVVLYQLCSMLVQRCPDHIHSASGQRQRPAGAPRPSDKCLRSLMLFCWHCIQVIVDFCKHLTRINFRASNQWSCQKSMRDNF